MDVFLCSTTVGCRSYIDKKLIDAVGAAFPDGCLFGAIGVFAEIDTCDILRRKLLQKMLLLLQCRFLVVEPKIRILSLKYPPSLSMFES